MFGYHNENQLYEFCHFFTTPPLPLFFLFFSLLATENLQNHFFFEFLFFNFAFFGEIPPVIKKRWNFNG